LSEELEKAHYKHFIIINSATTSDPLNDLILKRKFNPLLRQLSGNRLWAARIRKYKDGAAIHFLNRGLVAVAHPTLKEGSGTPILQDFHSDGKDNILEYAFDDSRINFQALSVRSPEIGEGRRPVVVKNVIRIDLTGIETYAVAQH
jgi:hypothetical protein